MISALRCLILNSLLLALIVASVLTGLQAQPRKPFVQDLWEDNPALQKVSSHLLKARRNVRLGLTVAESRRRNPLLKGKGNLLEIDITLWELTPEIVEELEQIGMEVTGAYYKYARVVGLIDPDFLDEVGAIPEVSTIHPNYPPETMAGSVTSQADSAINADTARSNFGIDGTGIKVGVISDSFHDQTSGWTSGSGCSRLVWDTNSQLSGDLPTLVIVPYNGPGGRSDEGRAMAELIHDLAPGAELMFYRQGTSESSIAEAVSGLANCGADVIVDDVIYIGEPVFQDGVIAQEAQKAVDAGVPYFSPAGNNVTFGIDETYLDWKPSVDDTSIPPSSNDFHDFGSGDALASVTIPALCGIKLVLQWNEPFDGMLGPGASSDLDLYLYDSGLNLLDFVNDSQGCGAGVPPRGTPREILDYTNPLLVPLTVHLAVEHYCGNEDLRFRVVATPVGDGCGFPGSYVFESGIFDKAQIYGHAAADGVVAAGAVDYREIEADGNHPDHPPDGQIDVESFSSLGGDIPFYFDGSGDPLPGAPVTRFKPEIAAPDGTNTTFFWEGGPDVEPDGFPNFYGTSAAAPHAAAVAALMLENNPTLTPAEIKQAMMDTAVDIESPGLDPLSGAGLIDAYDAVSDTDITSLINDLVTWYYSSILNRSPDGGGLAYWISEVKRIIALGIDIKEGFIAIGKLFFNSTEYGNRNRTDSEYVTDLYWTFLHRAPDPGGLTYWTNALAGGLTRNLVLNNFIFSTEFRLYMEGVFGAKTTRPEYNLVNDLYRGFLSRLPDGSGFNYWLGRKQKAQCDGDATAIRALTYEIALGFLYSQEYINRGSSNTEYIEDLYNGIMRRAADLGGYIYWLARLNGSTYTRQQLLQIFVYEPEFQNRVQDVIDAGCECPGCYP